MYRKELTLKKLSSIISIVFVSVILIFVIVFGVVYIRKELYKPYVVVSDIDTIEKSNSTNTKKDIIVVIDPWIYSITAIDESLTYEEEMYNAWNMDIAAPWIYVKLYPYYKKLCSEGKYLVVSVGNVAPLFREGNDVNILSNDSVGYIDGGRLDIIDNYMKSKGLDKIYMCGWALNTCVANYSKLFRDMGYKTILILDKSLYFDYGNYSYEEALGYFDYVIYSEDLE